MAANPPQRVLFISTGNAVRSIFAEYLLNSKKIGHGRFEAFSAGSQPTGTVHPYVIQILRDHYKINASGARSKSWDEFRTAEVEMVITVCDRARESCPFFPGQPEIANWNIPNPYDDDRTNIDLFIKFKEVAQQIQTRIQLLCSFPREKLTHLNTKRPGSNS
jgi:arsenate reductase (thioredoxin)